jgi:hypothetical protein
MTDPTKRIANWDAKYSTERIKATLDDKRPGMLASVTAIYPMIAAMELQVKQVCDGAGVPTIQYPFYLCFGRELWALSRKDISGESLAIEAATLIAKWVARDLTEAVLQAIRTDVFNVAAPLAPQAPGGWEGETVGGLGPAGRIAGKPRPGPLAGPPR